MKQKRAGRSPPNPPTPVQQISAIAPMGKTARKGSLAEFLLDSPLRGAALDLTRQRDEPQDAKDFAPFGVPLLNRRED